MSAGQERFYARATCSKIGAKSSRAHFCNVAAMRGTIWQSCWSQPGIRGTSHGFYGLFVWRLEYCFGLDLVSEQRPNSNNWSQFGAMQYEPRFPWTSIWKVWWVSCTKSYQDWSSSDLALALKSIRQTNSIGTNQASVRLVSMLSSCIPSRPALI